MTNTETTGPIRFIRYAYLTILLATCLGVWSLAHALNNSANTQAQTTQNFFQGRAVSCTILLDLAVKPAELPVSCHDPRVLTYYNINQASSVSRTTSQRLVCALYPVLKAAEPLQCSELPPLANP